MLRSSGAGDKSVAVRTYFVFDPNTVSFPDLIKLGFNRHTANRIIRYRSKGGAFRAANDLNKIYGIDSALVSDLRSYMIFPESNTATVELNQSNVNAKEKLPEIKKHYETRIIIDLNTADSADLVNVNGIGPTFASRIVKFRNRLGGFVSKEQLKEVYGLTPEHYETIAPNVVVNSSSVKKININMATLDELKSHVYFKYNVAKAIVAYREQHGAFKSKDDLKQVALVDDAFYQKIEPYIAID